MGKYSQSGWGLRQQNRELMAQYSQLQQQYSVLAQRQQAAENRARDEARRAQLHAMRLQGYPIDLTDEIQRCSAATMSDEAFQNHLDTIARYSQPARIPVGVSLPIADDLPPAARQGMEPDFTSLPEFHDAVRKACYAEQCKPTYNPSDTQLYTRMRAQVVDEWRQRKASRAV